MKAGTSRAPTDGDLVRKVKLCGISKSGKPIRPWIDCPEIDALIDTGATVTIISRTLAELAGADVVPGLQILHGRTQDAALMTVKLAAPGCGRITLLVVVNDHWAATAGPRAFMILGHDYLRGSRAKIDYAGAGSIRCPPRRKGRST